MKTVGLEPPVGPDLQAVARLYYTGVGSKRYKRASTQQGPGEPLCFLTVAQYAVRVERAKQKALTDLLRESRQMIADLNSAYGADGPDELCERIDSALRSNGAVSGVSAAEESCDQ